MTMKKLTALLLAMLMLFSLAACGGSEESAAPESTAPDGESAAPAQGDASASTWPSTTVNLYLPATAGGGTDMIGRVFADTISKLTGESFIVVNDTTGGGTVATEQIRNAKPDGENLLITNTAFCRSIADGSYPYSLDQFTCLGALSTQGVESGGIYVSAASEFETLDDLIAYAKENTLIVGVNGTGGMATQVMFDDQVGIATNMVDAGSDADRVTSLIGGNIQAAYLNTISAKAYVESGDLRCLVIGGKDKSEFLPDVPTMTELGYEPFVPDMSLLLMGPLGMDPNDVAKAASLLEQCCADAELQESYAKLATEWVYKTPEETLEIIAVAQDAADEAYNLLVEKGLM